MVFETYYRKRCKKPQQHHTLAPTAMEQINGSSITTAPVLGRHHHVPAPPSSDHCTTHLQLNGDESQMRNHIEVGSLYEIDHTHLPPKTPVQLRSIRVAMVCEKTEMSVGVRFPSMESLRAFFSYSARETHPALDEKFVMGTAMAKKVLIRLVPSEIFSEQKNLECFWLINCDSFVDTPTHKKGNCLLELKGNGILRWGVRRQVKYLGRHRENNDVYIHNSSSSFVNGSEEAQMELLDQNGCDERETEEEKDIGDDDNEDGNDEDGEEKVKEEDMVKEEEEEEEEDEKSEDDKKNLKRKRYPFRNLSNKKPKRGRPTIKNRKKNQTKKNKTKKKFKEALVLRNPKDRWSPDRYKLAEQNLLEVMKAKAATAEKPILRPQLRAEARKRIGDTGLLDHLLKHMAGKLAPGGGERFRRRHNADGAMEYWLESADLVIIRKDAGVTDPYWVPPPGWRLGDSPTQDPTCARELKLLKDEIDNIKREVEFRATNEQLEEEVGRLRREIGEISCKRREEESQGAKIMSSPSEISQNLSLLAKSLVVSKSDLEKAPVILEKYKEQLLVISDFVKEIEANIGNLISKVEENTTLHSTLIDPSESAGDDKQKKQPKSQKQKVQSFIAAGQQTSKLNKYQNNTQSTAAPKKTTSPVEQKAEKIERLKSGFRICKPQGTFLWPNMVKNNNNNVNQYSSNNMILSPHQLMQVQVETPPSVSSSSASAPPQLPYRNPASPVKPLAERRPVTVKVNNLTKSQSFDDGDKSYSTPSALINLNDAPITMPALIGASAYVQNQQTTGCCSSSISSFSSDQVVNWLALSSILKSNSSDESKNGELDDQCCEA